MSPVEYLCELLEVEGVAAYLGEPVSQKEHALQAAAFASREGADPALVAAALLHDVGHLLAGRESAEASEDGFHEERAAAWLAWHFGPEVTEPVRLHVTAKRYLCTVEPEYRQRLSSASIESLEWQGGLLSLAEIREFEQSSYHRNAVHLRRWDEAAKIPGLAVPGLDTYRETLQRLVIHDV
jgi:phosphonate degradation associated HDIG domain protein